MNLYAAVDLGASSGRVMAGTLDSDTISLRSVHRFANGIVEGDGHLRWDLTRLFTEVRVGLAQVPEATSIGIDTWGVDYGLLDAEGTLLAEPISYRDERTAAVLDDVHATVPPAEMWAHNGLQLLPFNTIYQLAAERRGPLWERAAHAVLLPDLLAYWLTGELATEVTNASTTGLLDVHARDWSKHLLDRIDIPVSLLPPVTEPGTVRGTTAAGTIVTTVASHDTASAVVGVPATTESFAFVSSGTWSLVGLELTGPVVTAEARGSAGFTNEAGVDGRTRFLRNVGGLWLLQESLRTWRLDLAPLLAQAAALPVSAVTFDVDDATFLAPGRMPERIADAVARRGGRPPATPAETVRTIVDSLAAAYADTVRLATELAGADVDVIHIVGGGSQNELLCQQTADRSGLPVLAGPVEATALGNIAIQARAHGRAPASLEGIRRLLAASSNVRSYTPS